MARPTPLTLTMTRAALAEFDRTAGEREFLFQHAKTPKDMNDWKFAEARAIEKVRRAFYEDTADRNRWSQCKVVTLSALREMLAQEDAR